MSDRVGFVPVATIIVALHLILFFDATSSNTDVVTTSTAVPFFASPDDDLPHGTEGYFDGTAFVILQTSLDIRRVTSLGFRTCTSQGLLFYQSGARGDSLKLELVAGGKLRMFWIVSGIEGSVESGQGLDDNKWHQASLSYASGNVHLGLDNLETLVANDSHHSELLRLDLSSPNPEVVVGQGYEGCLLQGAGLVFQDVSVTSVGVNWTTCPLPKRGGCDDHQVDYCFSQPCHKHGICLSSSDGYSCQCTARYSGHNCETDTGPLCDRSDFNRCQNGGVCQEDKTGNATTCACPPKFTGRYCELPADWRLCDATSCRNNATCQLNGFGDGYECLCLPGFTGANCEVDIDECRSSPCQHSGICVDGVNDYICQCQRTGYRGRHCEENIDECVEDEPCFNGGKCQDTSGGYVCECPAGFSGRNCEKEVDECASSPCKNGGTCQNLFGRYQCLCPSGYEGNDCETDIDDCVDVTCPTHAHCEDGVASYLCACDAGYQGVSPNCTNVNECATGPCANGATCLDDEGTFRCVCPEGYTGATCEVDVDECASQPCLGGGTCVDKVGTFVCQCLPGLTGRTCTRDLDECISQPCLNGGRCEDKVGTFDCHCVQGWSGRHCEFDVDECESSPCQNGGRCEDRVGDYLCHCLPQWMGHNCEVNTEPCFPNPCLNGGECLKNNNGSQCICNDGFEGDLCQTQVDECASNPCLNGGTCIDGPGAFRCSCPEDFVGKTCATPRNDCITVPCLNGGTCFPRTLDQNDTAICACPNGFVGDRCQIDVDECQDVTCPEGHLCFDLPTRHECRCPAGRTGSSCQEMTNECGSHVCINGVCVNGADGNITCQCSPGYGGPRCEDDVDECLTKRPCFNGKCENTVGSFLCWCRPGYAGTRCDREFDECLSQPCRNGASCRDLVDGYKCLCPFGYTGKNCETDIDECASNPCHHGATCKNEQGGFKCLCTPGRDGVLCEEDVDECASNPCRNQGLCLDLIADFECNCTDTGFQGEFCEENLDDCTSTPCFNDGNCTDLVKDYACRCHPGYRGKNCDIDVPECESTPCLNGGSCYEKSDRSLYALDDLQRPQGFPSGLYNPASAGGYVCVCALGFTGADCHINIDDCIQHPCGNGTCIDGIASYECQCHLGFEGRHCETEIDECRRHRPCAQGSTCINLVGDYSCVCAPGVGGKNCTVQLLGCVRNECSNGGTCVPYLDDNGDHKHNCVCPPGFYGAACQFSTTMSFTNDSDRMLVMGNMSRDYTLALRFRTTLPDVLLALGYGGYRNLYYILFLESGVVHLWLGDSNSASTARLSLGKGLDNGRWWTVNVNLTLDGLGVAVRGDGTNDTWNASQAVNFGGHKPVLSSTNVGTKAPWINPEPNFRVPNFIGCMEDVQVSGGMVVPGVEPSMAQSNGVTYIGSVVPSCVRTEQCLPSTCNGGGRCIDLWKAYECRCYRPYYGLHCEHEIEALTFGHENVTDSLVEVNLTPAEASALRSNATVSMFVRTRKSHGLLFYLGNGDSLDGAGDDDTFLAAEWESGVLRVSVKINGTPESLVDKVGRRLDDGNYHFLRVSLVNRTLSADVNGSTLFSMEVEASKDRRLDASRLYLGGLPPPRFGVERDAFHSSSSALVSLSSLPPPPPLAPSGTIVAAVPRVTGVPFFKGIMQDVRVNDWLVKVFDDPEASDKHPAHALEGNVTIMNVKRGVHSDDACRSNPCQNGSNCTVTWNDYFCKCVTGFRGKNCTELEYCAFNSCPKDGECRSLVDGYECITDATFNGVDSDVVYVLHSKSNVTFRHLSFRYRSQYGGPVLQVVHGSRQFRVTLLDTHELRLTWGTVDVGPPAINITVPLYVDDHTKWHSVNVTTKGDAILVRVDNNERTVGNVTVEKILEERMSDGGDQLLSATIGSFETNSSGRRYKGCLGEVRLGDILLPFYLRSQLSNDTSPDFFEASRVNNLETGVCRLCYDADCQQGATCLDDRNSFQCNCSVGYEGQFCEIDIDECQGVVCQNGGTCHDKVGAHVCLCQPGFEGQICEHETNECESSPCRNGGTCDDLMAAYVCRCNANFTGTNCEKEKPFDCSSHPCVEGATCINVEPFSPFDPGYQCHCPAGKTGIGCEIEIDICESHPCQNAGTCMGLQGGSFICSCLPGFKGETCSQRVDRNCENNPCLNSGVCIGTANGYICKCPPGYSGLNCSEWVSVSGDSALCVCPQNFSAVDLCNDTYPVVPSPCQNDGTCTLILTEDGVLQPNCTCQPGYEGPDCDANRSGNEVDSVTLAIVIGSVVAATVLIVVVVLIVFLTMAKKKRATRGTYSPSRQEMFGSRVEMGHVMKPPPEERLI